MEFLRVSFLIKRTPIRYLFWKILLDYIYPEADRKCVQKTKELYKLLGLFNSLRRLKIQNPIKSWKMCVICPKRRQLASRLEKISCRSHNRQPTQNRYRFRYCLSLSLCIKSDLLRSPFYEDSLLMSIHPETEYEFMACSNKLEVVCSLSEYESDDSQLEVFHLPKVGSRNLHGDGQKHGFPPFLYLRRIAGEPQWFFLRGKEDPERKMTVTQLSTTEKL